MKDIIASLEDIAHLVDRNSDLTKIQTAIQALKSLVETAGKKIGQAERTMLEQLETELGIWQSKCAVILTEEAGRKGMAKHARFWAEKLRGIHV